MNFIKGQEYNINKNGIEEGEFIYYGMYKNKDVNNTCYNIKKSDLGKLQQINGDCYVFVRHDNKGGVYIYSVDPSELQADRIKITPCNQYNFTQITTDDFLCDWEKYPSQFRDIFIETYRKLSLSYSEHSNLNHGISQAIKGGALTSMVSTTGKISNSIDTTIIQGWYETADMDGTKVPLIVQGEKWCFYRNIKSETLLDGTEFIQPLPTSYTTSLDFALRWNSFYKCCIIKLLVPMGTPITFLDHHKDDNIQSEVVVPAGIITIIDKRKMGDKIVVIGQLEPWTFEDCYDYIIKNPQENPQ